MAKIEVNTIDTISGSTNLTIGSTNTSTITLPNGAVTGQNYPAFEAYLSSDQTLSQNSNTKIQFNAELFDTDNCYDNATNYRFTPTTAGKYFCYTNIASNYSGGGSGNVIELKFYKNGSAYSRQRIVEDNSNYLYGVINNSMIIDFNGTTDYLEIYVNSPHGTPVADGGSLGAELISNFGAYRLGA